MTSEGDLRKLLQDIVAAYEALGLAEVPPPGHVGPSGWVDARPKFGAVDAARATLSECIGRARLLLQGG
jgi:hypothetical protein